MALPDDPLDERCNTLGRPLPGIEIKITDPETGLEQPAGEVGELCWRGYNRFDGYYKDPDATANAIDNDDWFHTGDLGAVDERGCFVYSGRLKDMLKVGGENVSSLEVEDYLARHPCVNMAQVVGAPDARYTEVPAVYIELKPGVTPPSRGGDDRVLRRPDRVVQGAALRALRRRVADVGDEDPEVRPARPDREGARGRPGSPRRRDRSSARTRPGDLGAGGQAG